MAKNVEVGKILPPIFSPNKDIKAETFILRVKQHMSANGITTNDTKLAIFSQLLAGEAIEWWSTSLELAFLNPWTKSFEETCKEFLKEFGEVRILHGIPMEQTFQPQKKDETISAFHTRCKKAALIDYAHLRPEDTDDKDAMATYTTTIQYGIKRSLIRGMRSALKEKLTNQVLEQDSDKIVEAAKVVETSLKNAKTITNINIEKDGGDTPPEDTEFKERLEKYLAINKLTISKEKNERVDKNKDKRTNDKNQRPKIKCFNCNKMGYHYSRDCRQPRRPRPTHNAGNINQLRGLVEEILNNANHGSNSQSGF